MSIKKYVTYTIIAAGIVGVGASIYTKTSLTQHAEASDTGKNNSVFSKAKEDINNIPVIKNKALNTNANYSVLEGSISRTFHENGDKQIVEFTIEQPGRFHAKHIPNAKNPNLFEESVNDGTFVKTKGSDGKLNESTPPSIAKKEKAQDLDKKISPDYNGTYLPFGGVNEMLHPEMFIQGALNRGKVTVKGEEKILGRDATVIVIDRDVKEGKIGNRQTFWFDNQTGIILKAVDADGDKPLRTTVFEKIKFSDKANEAIFKSLK